MLFNLIEMIAVFYGDQLQQRGANEKKTILKSGLCATPDLTPRHNLKQPKRSAYLPVCYWHC